MDGKVGGEGAVEGGVVVAGDGLAGEGEGGGDEPVGVADGEGGAEEGFAGAEGEGVGGAVEGDDEGARAGGDAQALALAAGVVGQACVGAEAAAGEVEDGARRGGFGVAAEEFGAVVATGEGSDVVAAGGVLCFGYA